MNTISLDEFKRTEIRVGTVVVAERIFDTDKLLRLEVDFGEERLRQILSGVAEYVDPKEIIDRQLLFITNLEPRIIRGLASNGMLLATGEGDDFTLLIPSKPVPPGSRVR